MPLTNWIRFADEESVPSPTLVLHLDRVEENLRRMVAAIGDVSRLRPHIKTHKLPQILQRQLALGIVQCKTATIAEAEMVATAGVPDVLLALQPVGPNIHRLLRLIEKFPQTHFSAICDDASVVAEIGKAASASGRNVELLLDLDVGQGRTGIVPDEGAAVLYHQLHSTRGVVCGGLHAYDGHLNQTDPAERAAACERAFEPVWKLRDKLRAAGLSVPKTVAGGSPTFPFHARRSDVECSPGTIVLWDAGYAARFPDLDYLHAATLLTRVISHPGADRLCLDLGHKAVASEMPHPRVVFPALPDAKVVAHNEEHLVLETARAADFPVGSVLHGIPWHICPTVALHSEVAVIRDGRVVENWPVVGRTRRITI